MFGDSMFNFNNCSIVGNVALGCGSGGGVYCLSGRALFRNCTITNNSVQNNSCGPAYGGGIYVASATLTNVNCIIAFNTAPSGGSGIYVDTGANATIQNCTIAYNNGGGLRGGGNTTIIRNSILYFNSGYQLTGTTNVTYSDVQGGSPGIGNKSVNPSLGPTLRITASSPCIDMGDPDSIYNDVCFPPSRGSNRNDMGAHGGPCACCWDGPCEAPIITQPQGAVACFGQQFTLCVTASGQEPFTYQWRFHGTNANGAPMNISEATNTCYTITNAQAVDAGYYSVAVSNAFGGVVSSPALVLVFPVCISIQMYAGLSITGQVGHAYCVQYVPNVEETNWTTLTNFSLSVPDYFYLDLESPFQPRRFYRVIEGPCP